MAVRSSDARPGTLTSPGDDTTSVSKQGPAWPPLLPPHRPELSQGAGPRDSSVDVPRFLRVARPSWRVPSSATLGKLSLGSPAGC